MAESLQLSDEKHNLRNSLKTDFMALKGGGEFNSDM